jgi:hypothetical protein
VAWRAHDAVLPGEALHHADPEEKSRIHAQLRLELIYDPAQQSVRAEVNLDPDDAGVMVRVRGGICTITSAIPLTLGENLPLLQHRP